MGSFPTRKLHRLSGYEYTTAGYYFVTLCIQGRLPLLGRIVSDDMRLSPAGDVVRQRCEEIPRLYSGIDLDTVMVMPDHLHAIISLGGDTESLSTVVHWLKSRSTSDYAGGVRSAGWLPFHGRLWQPGFYDRVIRDDQELNAIREYVMQNALRWSLREQGV